MKQWLKGFACIVSILGFMGSFVLSYYGGVREYGTYYTYYGRDWALTLGIFAGGFISTTVISIILCGLAEVLENQEKILIDQDCTLTSVQMCHDRITDIQKQMEEKYATTPEQ